MNPESEHVEIAIFLSDLCRINIFSRFSPGHCVAAAELDCRLIKKFVEKCTGFHRKKAEKARFATANQP
jgi:hypothetical protein